MIIKRQKEFGKFDTFLRHTKRNIGSAITKTKLNLGKNLNSEDVRRISRDVRNRSINGGTMPTSLAKAAGVGERPLGDLNAEYKMLHRNGRGAFKGGYGFSGYSSTGLGTTKQQWNKVQELRKENASWIGNN